jgi:CDP-2,3-bis-(O-geranylgeranyl)-sn-glycerol synthase
MAPSLDAAACGLFLITAFAVAGMCQAVWLGSPISRKFDTPIDGGRTWRGRRIFGDNKTLRGFVVMVPATALSFAFIAAAWPEAPNGGLWPMSAAEYAQLGAWAGFGFMAGELPNSFVKRRLGVEPGARSEGRYLGPLLAAVDRSDSVMGAMAFLAAAVSVPLATWLLVAVVGPALHGCFSVAVFALGGKARLG